MKIMERDTLYSIITEAAESSESDGNPPDFKTWIYATMQLSSIMSVFRIPLPIVAPLHSGGMGAEWHDNGLNIELRFRSPNAIWAVVEDAQNTVTTFSGYVTHSKIHSVFYQLNDRNRSKL